NESRRNVTIGERNSSINRSTSKLSKLKKPNLSRTGSISLDLTLSTTSLHTVSDTDDALRSPSDNIGQKILEQKSNSDEAGDSLITGLLSKYFGSKFFDQVEKMDKTARAQIIKHLLMLFEKVDKLLMVSSFISLDVNVERAMEEIVDEAAEMMQAEQILLYLVDAETKELLFKEPNSQIDPKELELLPVVSFPPGTGIAGWVAMNEQTLNVRDAQSNEKFEPDVDARGINSLARSILCVPLKTRDNITKGVLLAVNKLGTNGQLQFFNPEDEFLLKTLGRQAGIILKNAEMYETMKKTQRKVEVLLETTRMLTSTLEINTLVKMIMDAAKDLLTADRCSLFLLDEQQQQLRGHIQYRDSIQEIRLSTDKGIAGHVYTTSTSVNIPEAYKDPRFNSDNISGKAIGVTQMINKKRGHFVTEDETILSSFSAQEDMRAHLQSILSSITSCKTMNRDWVMTALGVTEEQMRTASIDQWIGQENIQLLEDISNVFESGHPTYYAEYELKESRGTGTFVNYQIMPLIGSEPGVVLVFEDISSEKRAIMTLGRYMSPSLAKQVMMEDGSQLGGTRKKVAILFSDIRSFTTYPSQWTLMNDAVNAINEEQGDAVMAVFGVPFVSPEDSVHACNAALRMKEALAISNEHRVSIGQEEVKIGIGVNTGMVLSGNIGSVKRMEFSCIGDAVNLASRIEGLTKHYHLTILITENTHEETNNLFHTREIDTVVVTGKTKEVKIYELLCKASEQLSQELEEIVDLYNAGMRLYRKRMFKQAKMAFATAVDKFDDGPSLTLMERCDKMIEKPPPENWTGAFQFDSK
ncbi:hypothetical protein HK096_006579, partial [Nowakowskiella sp. JEL0078]